MAQTCTEHLCYARHYVRRWGRETADRTCRVKTLGNSLEERRHPNHPGEGKGKPQAGQHSPGHVDLLECDGPPGPAKWQWWTRGEWPMTIREKRQNTKKGQTAGDHLMPSWVWPLSQETLKGLSKGMTGWDLNLTCELSPMRIKAARSQRWRTGGLQFALDQVCLFVLFLIGPHKNMEEQEFDRKTIWQYLLKVSKHSMPQ